MTNRTIADRLKEAQNTGKEAKFYGTSDLLTSGIEYDFTPSGLLNYINASGYSRTLSQSSAGWAWTGDANETTVLTLTGVVPANAIGPTGILKITTLWSCTVNDASVKTGRLKINGTTVDNATLTSTRAFQRQLILRNKTTASQVTTGANHASLFATSASAVTPYTFDTTAALDITFTIQNALAADSSKLESYQIEVLYGA